MREYLGPVIKADQSAQYVDDIGIAANLPEQLIINLRAVFKCIQNAGLKLSKAKCRLGRKERYFLRRIITPNGVSPHKDKIRNFLEKDDFPRFKKALQQYIGFLEVYWNYLPRLPRRLNLVFRLRKSTENKAKFMIAPELVKELHHLYEDSDTCCELALRHPLTDKQ